MKRTKQGVQDLNGKQKNIRSDCNKYESCLKTDQHKYCSRVMPCDLCGFYANWPEYTYERDKDFRKFNLATLYGKFAQSRRK